MQFKKLLGPDIQGVGRALEYFRRAAKETDNVIVRPSANERAYFSDAVRILSTPLCAERQRLSPPGRPP